ncbi:hypothetical protein [Natronomonas sp. LN261]|uniref:hypothetical protein n=1 Tax=Natronomonas sp. LN261 TaxID=2750669 RepID=UPI0015EE5783|nr:hypothetical protein [Natronomonas sp. LN261]
MSPNTGRESLPFVEGAIAGAAAWIVGYVLTALVVLTRIDRSELGEISRNVEGDGSSIDFVGWVFFNSHFVDTVLEAGILGIGGTRTVSFVGGDGFTPLLHLVPVALLVAAGIAVGRSQGVTDTAGGAIAGVLVVPPYLALSAAGAVVFRVSTEALGASFSGEPELLPAVVLAGVVLPAVFGSLGGIAAAVTHSGRRS